MRSAQTPIPSSISASQRYIIFLIGLLFFASFCPSLSYSSEHSNSTETAQISDDILIVPQQSTGNARSQLIDADRVSEPLLLTYDPKSISAMEANPDLVTRRDQLKMIFQQEQQALVTNDKDTIFIPELPHSEEHFKKMLTLDDREIEVYLQKKSAFLHRFAKILSKIKLKKTIINKAILDLNLKFGEASLLIARSNTTGGTAMLSISGGLALPQKIIEKISETRIGKWIPKTGGFFYLFGAGIGLSKSVSPTGKTTTTADIFIDVERLKSTLTGILEVSAAGTAGIIYESRNAEFSSQKNETAYGGATGVFRQGENQFGWAASLGGGLPPMIGAILVYKNQATRYYLVRIDNEGIRSPAFKELVSLAKFALARASKKSQKNITSFMCQQVFH